MALTQQEAAYARAIILHGNIHKAIQEAFPKLEYGFEAAAMRYMEQNPEVRNHIEAGILYFYKDIVIHTQVPEPQPLTIEEKELMLKMVIEGVRETPAYIVAEGELRQIFTEPDEEAIELAKLALQQLKEGDNVTGRLMS